MKKVVDGFNIMYRECIILLTFKGMLKFIADFYVSTFTASITIFKKKNN